MSGNRFNGFRRHERDAVEHPQFLTESVAWANSLDRIRVLSDILIHTRL